MNDSERNDLYRSYLIEFLVDIEVELMFTTDDRALVMLWAARDGFTARLSAHDADVGDT